MDGMDGFFRWVKTAARAGRGARVGERERVEDALKELHRCERAGRECAASGLAAGLADRLVAGGLARPVAGGLELTEAGRTYARRVVRTHRLWERYLADRTAVPAEEWHREAERMEHELEPADVERLASRLGDPRYDPHGDPIPTAAGEIPAPSGIALSGVAAGRSVRVVHLEDEPSEVFDRLVAAGLAPGLTVEVTAVAVSVSVAGRMVAPDRSAGVVLRVRGEERRLTAEEADNVTVEPLPPGTVVPGRPRTLAQVGRGETAVVAGISPTCQGPQRRRLLDLGVVPGTRIEVELVSPSGDPVAYRLRDALIALRREQAGWIEVEAAD